jgi:hypothetical protein
VDVNPPIPDVRTLGPVQVSDGGLRGPIFPLSTFHQRRNRLRALTSGGLRKAGCGPELRAALGGPAYPGVGDSRSRRSDSHSHSDPIRSSFAKPTRPEVLNSGSQGSMGLLVPVSSMHTQSLHTHPGDSLPRQTWRPGRRRITRRGMSQLRIPECDPIWAKVQPFACRQPVSLQRLPEALHVPGRGSPTPFRRPDRGARSRSVLPRTISPQGLGPLPAGLRSLRFAGDHLRMDLAVHAPGGQVDGFVRRPDGRAVERRRDRCQGRRQPTMGVEHRGREHPIPPRDSRHETEETTGRSSSAAPSQIGHPGPAAHGTFRRNARVPQGGGARARFSQRVGGRQPPRAGSFDPSEAVEQPGGASPRNRERANQGDPWIPRPERSEDAGGGISGPLQHGATPRVARNDAGYRRWTPRPRGVPLESDPPGSSSASSRKAGRDHVRRGLAESVLRGSPPDFEQWRSASRPPPVPRTEPPQRRAGDRAGRLNLIGPRRSTPEDLGGSARTARPRFLSRSERPRDGGSSFIHRGTDLSLAHLGFERMAIVIRFHGGDCRPGGLHELDQFGVSASKGSRERAVGRPGEAVLVDRPAPAVGGGSCEVSGAFTRTVFAHGIPWNRPGQHDVRGP